LISAAYAGNRRAVKLLLKNGADVTAKSKQGWTALKAAEWGDHYEIVAILKAHGAKE
jgi:uncharacterized protein